jgi:hypothetical protein
MVTPYGFGAISHPVGVDCMGSNDPTVWETGGEEASKEEGHSDDFQADKLRRPAHP